MSWGTPIAMKIWSPYRLFSEETMELTSYQPQSKLVGGGTEIRQPRFPVIDAHNHTMEEFANWSGRPVEEFVAVLDLAGVSHFVDLDGGWGEDVLQQRLEHFAPIMPERYTVFGGVNWEAWPEQKNSFGEWAAERFRQQVAWGARGLKVWKQFGLHVRDHEGELVAVDDQRLDPLWATVGELGLPVLIHIADPVAFFDPIDRYNERWEELDAHPDWHFPSPPYPSFETVVEQGANLVRRHPETTFIGAHVGWYAENLEWVGNLLAECPNFYVDLGHRIAELGRQPYSARRFFLEYPDRILFGTDRPAELRWYQLFYRFLETDDEYFNYDVEPIPTQGRWHIHGIHLPDEVLKKVYHENASKVLQLIEESDMHPDQEQTGD